MAVAPERGMQEAALTPPRSDRPDPRRDSRSAPAGDAPAAPADDLLLFPPEPDALVSQPRVRVPLRVRRSAHAERGARPGEGRRGAASASEAAAPGSEAAAPGSEAAAPASEPARPRLARPGVRLAAGCCDLALLAGLDAAVVWLTLRLTGLDLQSLDALPLAPLAAFLCLLDAGYLVGLTAAGGQTIGKMAWGLRVADADGGPVSLPMAVARTLWTPVSMTVGVGVVWIGLGREGRVLHDVLSGTRVVAVSPAPHEPPEDGTA